MDYNEDYCPVKKCKFRGTKEEIMLHLRLAVKLDKDGLPLDPKYFKFKFLPSSQKNHTKYYILNQTGFAMPQNYGNEFGVNCPFIGCITKFSNNLDGMYKHLTSPAHKLKLSNANVVFMRVLIHKFSPYRTPNPSEIQGNPHEITVDGINGMSKITTNLAEDGVLNQDQSSMNDNVEVCPVEYCEFSGTN